jgi:hypothetical protein
MFNRLGIVIVIVVDTGHKRFIYLCEAMNSATGLWIKKGKRLCLSVDGRGLFRAIKRPAPPVCGYLAQLSSWFSQLVHII